jgi:ATP-binding cassette subfamily B (MDR/TAP) protein 10
MFFLKSINSIQTFNKFVLLNNFRSITTNISKCNQQARNDMFNRVLNLKKDSNQISFFTTHMSIFLRRNRMFSRTNKKNLSKEELKKIKVSKSEIRRLLSLAKPEKYRLSLAMTLLIISSSITMIVPFFIGKLIDFIQTSDKTTMKDNLKKISLGMAALFIIGALANFGRVYLIQSSGQRIVVRLRESLFKSVMNQEMAFFDQNKTGELINRLSTDTEIVGLSISQNLSDGLRSTIQALGGVGMMLYVSPYLGAIGLSIVPAVTIFAIVFGRYIKKLSKQVQDVLAEATEVAEEKLSNIRTVRAFAQEEKETNTYMKSINKVMTMKFKEALAYGVFYGTTGFSGNVIILSVFYFGGASIADQVITIGDLSAFLMYSAWVGISIAGLSSFYTELMRGIGASTRTWEIIDRKPEMFSASMTAISSPIINPRLLKKDISFENVNFSYPTRLEQKIFNNLNLTIPGGKVLAIVGPSGSGKSTIGSLMLRFYDPQEGTIKIGNHDIRDMPPSWLRSHIGTVPQEPVLFSMSIKDNIAYGMPNPESIPLEKIYEAADLANAFSFIQQFPDKFNTIVGERGMNLSGGQKQRIAIARAILRNPEILVLDEATSALDAASEYLVQEALEKIMENRTVIIIAHRLSTIKNADLIAVIDKGQVAELGNYSDLLQKDNGQFKELVARQTIDVDYSVNME